MNTANFSDRPLVVFDLDGTLIDSAEDIIEAQVYALTTAGGRQESELDQYLLRSLIGKGLREVFELQLPKSAWGQIDECIVAYRAYHRAHGNDHTTMFPGAIELLRDLKAAGRTLAIATTKFTSTADHIADLFGFAQYFDLIQGSEDVDFPLKPDPHILNLVMRETGLEPQQTVMIGDTDNDVLCAQRAGAASIAATWGAWTYEKLAALNPAAIVHSYAELRGLLL